MAAPRRATNRLAWLRVRDGDCRAIVRRVVRVFCLEGNWRPEDLALQDSLEPLLQLLQRHRLIEYIRRDIATRGELEQYLKVWGHPDYAEYEFCYLAFHGNRGKAILLDDDALSLRDLGRMLRKHRAANNAVIHIASCYGLRVTEDAPQEFLEQTRAWAVSGYTKSVDATEAAAFELLLFNTLGGPWREIGARYALLEEKYPNLCDVVGFTWAQ